MILMILIIYYLWEELGRGYMITEHIYLLLFCQLDYLSSLYHVQEMYSNSNYTGGKPEALNAAHNLFQAGGGVVDPGPLMTPAGSSASTTAKPCLKCQSM